MCPLGLDRVKQLWSALEQLVIESYHRRVLSQVSGAELCEVVSRRKLKSLSHQVNKITMSRRRSRSYSSSPLREIAQDLNEGLSAFHYVLRLALDELEDLHPARLWKEKGRKVFTVRYPLKPLGQTAD